MFTPRRARCGVSDYSGHLLDALRAQPEIREARVVEAPDDTPSSGLARTLRQFASEERRYRALGAQMNAQADVAHIQHQYFFFGGVAPHKNHARAFLDGITVPVVLTVHEIASAPKGANALMRQAVDLTNRRNFLHPVVRALIVHTIEDRESLLALGARPERIHVVTHATPPALPMPSAGDAKRALGLGGRRVVTLFGFLAAKKGHTLALDALPLLPPDVTLLFAGGQHPQDHGGYVADLRARVENIHAAQAASGRQEERARITNWLEDAEVLAVMAATDAAIAPFSQTSGSGSLANLFAYGRAIVASDIAPHRALVADAPGSLLLFPAGSAEELAARINDVLADDARRAALQQAARAFADRHSYLEMARQTVKIYQSAL